ncbi:MAG: hypothetical protein ACYSR8_11630, partial [Planctomycetota bacterium]
KPNSNPIKAKNKAIFRTKNPPQTQNKAIFRTKNPPQTQNKPNPNPIQTQSNPIPRPLAISLPAFGILTPCSYFSLLDLTFLFTYKSFIIKWFHARILSYDYEFCFKKRL